MSRYEKIVHLPSLMVSPKTAERVDSILEGLAAERLNFLIEQQIGQFAQLRPGEIEVLGLGAPSRAELARQTFDTTEYREFLRRSYGAKYTYLSEHGSVEFVGETYSDDDIPMDLECVMAEAWGAGERHVAVHIKARTLPFETKSPAFNRILVQSSPDDRAWVNDIHAQLAEMARAERNAWRDFVYQWLSWFTWAAFLSLVAIEYRLSVWLRGFNWRTPLNGLELLIAFAVLIVDLILAFQIFSRVLQHAFPYFEFEGNLSKSRLGLRKLIRIGLTALYTGGLVSIFYH